MNFSSRHIDSQLVQHFHTRRQVLILEGARQVGKTTALTRLFPHAQYFLVDNEPVQQVLETYDVNTYRQLFGTETDTLILDEIHLLSDPGRAAKIIYDQMPDIKLIITGSSSLNIRNKTTESLAGRKITYHMYPLTLAEYLYQNSITLDMSSNLLDVLTSVDKKAEKRAHAFDLQATLSHVLLYGLYPQTVQQPEDIPYLENLADSVIFKDILDLNLIDNKKNALRLLRLLAFQIGNLINYSEIATRLAIDARTINRYIEIFEQSYIIFRLYPFSQNKRDEIGKMPKIYFYDTGLRNALIGQFEDIALRQDRGALFENLVITEVLKHNVYTRSRFELHYWRLSSGAEIDLVLTRGKDEINGVEIKWLKEGYTKAFQERYPQASVQVVTSENIV